MTAPLTEFEQQLEARSLLEAARAVVQPFGLRPDDLQRTSSKKAAPVVAEARSRFVQLLRDRGWTGTMVAALLGYRDRCVVHMLVDGPQARNRSKRFEGIR
jgi:hypothetical protein